MPTEESLDAFYRAADIIETSNQGLSEQECRDAISLLTIAVKKAGEPFSRANALLAILYYEMGDMRLAKNYANVALEQDPTEFRAQFIKVHLALEGVEILTTNARGLIPRGIGAFYILEVFGKIIKGIFHGTKTTTTQLLFKNEVSKLIEIYRQLCQEEIYAVDFLYLSDRLIYLADLISTNKVPMPGGRLNIYREVANAPTDNIVFDGEMIEDLKIEVRKMRQLAEGRALSF